MNSYKEHLTEIHLEMQKLADELLRLSNSNSISKKIIGRNISEFFYKLERLCIKSRIILDKYNLQVFGENKKDLKKIVSDVCGQLEVTDAGWLHITLNTLLPSEKYKVSNYISDTISRLISEYDLELPYFENAFLGIVEYCNYATHNSLDNDNKGWKMIPNVLKGRVIKDDNQFLLSIGLFAKISEDIRCEIYVLPQEDLDAFMRFLS